MSLKGQNVLITGASMGIGAAIARRLAKQKANLILLARNEKKLQELARELQVDSGRLVYCTADISRYDQVEDAVRKAVKEIGDIDILVNNAGLALGAPNRFPDLKVEDIVQMTRTNIDGYMFAAYAALNVGGMKNRKRGIILNVTSVTGLEVPPFPGEAVYHASKAAQEAFTDSLRVELSETNIKVMALRPGIVATHFHQQRVGFDKRQYDDFMEGMEPLLADDVAESAAFMLNQHERVSITNISVVPTAQRTLQVIDRTWNERNQVGGSNSRRGGQQGSHGQRGGNDQGGDSNNDRGHHGGSSNQSSSSNQRDQPDDDRRGSGQSKQQQGYQQEHGSSTTDSSGAGNKSDSSHDNQGHGASRTNSGENNNSHNSYASSRAQDSAGNNDNRGSSRTNSSGDGDQSAHGSGSSSSNHDKNSSNKNETGSSQDENSSSGSTKSSNGKNESQNSHSNGKNESQNSRSNSSNNNSSSSGGGDGYSSNNKQNDGRGRSDSDSKGGSSWMPGSYDK